MPWIALDESTAQAAPVVTTGRPKTSVGSTLLTMRADLIRIMANRADLINSTPLQNKFINQGYRHLCSMLVSLPQLKTSLPITTVASQPFYLLPVNAAGSEAIAAIRQVGTVDPTTFVPGGRPLDPIDEGTYRTLPDRVAEPCAYFRYGSMLVLWPTPKTIKTVVVDGMIRPQDLVADTDSPILPQEFHEGLPLAAKARALRDAKEYEAQALAENDLVAFLRPITDFEGEEEAVRGINVCVPSRKPNLRRWYY